MLLRVAFSLVVENSPKFTAGRRLCRVHRVSGSGLGFFFGLGNLDCGCARLFPGGI